MNRGYILDPKVLRDPILYLVIAPKVRGRRFDVKFHIQNLL